LLERSADRDNRHDPTRNRISRFPAGRLTLAAGGSQLSFAGHTAANTEALCAALAP
jgi:hypothetical protein